MGAPGEAAADEQLLEPWAVSCHHPKGAHAAPWAEELGLQVLRSECRKIVFGDELILGN